MRIPVKLTALSIPNDTIESSYKLGKDGVNVVQAGQDIYDVGARVGVFLGKYGGKESRQGLHEGIRELAR